MTKMSWPASWEDVTTEQITQIIAAGADVNERSASGNTPLFDALEVREPDINVIAKLIELGADVNARDKGTFTPLHRTNDPKITQLLIDSGADIHAKNNRGMTP